MSTMRLAGVIAIGLFCSASASTSGAPDESVAAERAVGTFYNAFIHQNWSDAARSFHPEVLKTIQDLLIHIAATTADLKDRNSFYRLLGVDGLNELKKLDPEVAFVRFFKFAWSQFPEHTRAYWKSSTLTVIGSVKEGELYHVVCRTNSSIGGVTASVVSVATAKKDKDTWKLLSSAEFQNLANTIGR